MDPAAGDVAGQVGLAVTAREVHDHARVGDHLDAVRTRLGLDHLPATDAEVQRQVRGTVVAVTEVDPVELGVDVDGGPRREVLPTAPVHPGAGDLVGKPCPPALGRRIGGHRQGTLDGRLVGDRRVELQHDGCGHADGLAVGELEPPVDHLVGLDGGERAADRKRPAVLTDHRTAPGVDGAVAQRLGDGEGGPLPVERSRDDLAVRVGQGDPLEPAVGDPHPDRRRRDEPDRTVVRGEAQHRLGSRRRVRCAAQTAAGEQGGRGQHGGRPKSPAPIQIHAVHCYAVTARSPPGPAREPG